MVYVKKAVFKATGSNAADTQRISCVITVPTYLSHSFYNFT